MAEKFKFLVPIILFLTTVEQFAVDVYLPSLPAMTDYFGVNASLLQHTITVYLLGFGLSPLIFGPLSDRFGRRKILIFSLGLYLITSFLCAITTHINMLLLARLFQGKASGGIVVANASMARDCYRGKRLIIVSSYMSMVWSLVPIIAPAIGGYVQEYLGWRANFYLMVVYTLPVTLCIIFALPETNPNTGVKLNLRSVLNRYLTFLMNRHFMVHVAATAIVFAVTIAFNTAAPFLFQVQLHMDAVAFGWLALAVALSYLLGTILNNMFVQYIQVNRLLLAGQIIMIAGSALMLVLGLMGIVTVAAIAIPASIVIMGEGFIYPNAAALAFDTVTEHTGVASALFGSIQLLACAAASAIVASLPESSQVPLALIMLSLSLLIAVFYAHLFMSSHSETPSLAHLGRK